MTLGPSTTARSSRRTKGISQSDGGLAVGTLGTFVFTNAGVPSAGTSGTGAGICGKGSLCIDTTGGKLYINTNTKASPTWTVVGSQS